MQEQFSRTQMLLGQTALQTLAASRVAVFGVGGVGGYAVEALVRSGIGEIDLFDNDTFSLSNLNRQIHALHSTLYRPKVDVAAERIADINPLCTVHPHQMFYLPENADSIDLSTFNYVLDCIDTLKAKLELARRCHRLSVPLISCMGAANKMDPSAFRITDISKTKMDPIAKIMRCTLRKEGIYHLKVAFSDEQPLRPTGGNSVPASNSFVPAVAGLVMAGQAVRDLIQTAPTGTPTLQ